MGNAFGVGDVRAGLEDEAPSDSKKTLAICISRALFYVMM